MILIFSSLIDNATNEVIDWLTYYNREFIRINEDQKTNIDIFIDNSDLLIKLNHRNQIIELDKINSYWYRRGYINNKYNKLKLNIKEDWKINNYLDNEYKTINDFFHLLLKDRAHIGSYLDNYINKIEMLYIAKKMGLDIPTTIITEKKADLKIFLQKKKEIISKGIANGFAVDMYNKRYYVHTMKLSEEDINGYPETFFPILVQECLDKKYELRIFYLKKELYASAIFSQRNEKTRVDFRNYDQTNPNRVCPFKVPYKIKNKIIKFMNYYKLDSGSIDIVVTKDDNYVFLEVNPVGQFEQVSKPCNYYLDKEMALKLIENEEQ